MSVFSFFNGPKLYAKFNDTSWQPNIVETISDYMFQFGRGVYNAITGFYPVIICYMYGRGMMNPASLTYYAQCVTVYIVIAYSTRLIGRMLDIEYRNFLLTWEKACNERKQEDIRALKQYDFEIAGGFIDFTAVPNDQLWYYEADEKECASNFLVKTVSYFCVHSFGRRIMYPGSVALLNLALSSALAENRKALVTNKKGERAWIKSAMGDTIDAIFLDMRKHGERGRTLVICCEGNAGFYEVGIAGTPIQLGYSVLGWNHPGFAESTGIPMPKNVLSAADAVMQYALGPLGFSQENIVLFGWSIGGYPSSWLAANYGQVRALVLDATFDDVLSLAVSRMPSFAEGIVKCAIRNHLNLQIDRHVHRYKGAVRLIRRLKEEIIITNELGTDDERRASNRANNLLKSIIHHRHPELIHGLESEVDLWLAVKPHQRITLASGRSLNPNSDSSRVQRLYSLCEHYFVDFDASHTQPLNFEYFNIPSPMLGR